MKLFVGCSSSNDIPNKYVDDCKIYLNELLENNDLVFGAYNAGLMGEAYNIAISSKRKIIGACPSVYEGDLLNLNCTKEIITDDILERTKVLIEEADALIFLPGGIGTILELIAAIDKKRNNEIDKPIIIYNSYNFFDGLFNFLEKIYEEKFSNESVKSCYYFSDSANSTINYINDYYKKRKVKSKK